MTVMENETTEMIRRLPEGWTPADTFGQRLIRLRKHLNLTVEEMAAVCGVSQATWSSWERGARPKKIGPIVDAIVNATKVDRGWLFYGEEPQNLKEMNPARRGRKALKDRTRPADTRPAGTPAFVPA